MKTIENFADDVLRKSKKKQQKKRLGRNVIALSLAGILIFLIAYSNILPIGNLFQSRAYERYMQSYATADRKMRLKILDGEHAALMTENRVRLCSLKEKNASTFSLTPESDSNAEDSLTVEFANGKAELFGKLEEERVEVTLNIVQDMQVQAGAWIDFDVKQHAGGTHGPILDWFFIDEQQSYCGTNDVTMLCKFVAVGDIVLQYVTDQVSGIATALLFETVPASLYGFPAIATTGYFQDDGTEYVTTYFKQVEKTEQLDFGDGKFQTKYIEYSQISEPFSSADYETLKHLESNVPWRFSPLQSIGKTRRTDITLSLDLKKDGTLSFRSSGNWLFGMSCGGKWYAFDSFVFVILEKEYPYFGLRAFTIAVDTERIDGEFLEAAVSEIRSEGLYKIGYHTFDYYFLTRNATIYWGSGWTEDVLEPQLIYERAYVLGGWTSDWRSSDQPPEKIPIEEAEPTRLIFTEYGTCRMYKGERFLGNVDYRVRMYGTGKKYVSLGSSQYVTIDGDRYYINVLDLGAGKLFIKKKEYRYSNGLEDVKESELVFSVE